MQRRQLNWPMVRKYHHTGAANTAKTEPKDRERQSEKLAQSRPGKNEFGNSH